MTRPGLEVNSPAHSKGVLLGSTGAKLCWNTKGPSLTLATTLEAYSCQKSFSIVVLKLPFTVSKQPGPNPGKQPQTTIPPPPNFTV